MVYRTSTLVGRDFAVNTIKARQLFTPDWKELTKFEGHAVFVWGNCKKFYRDYFKTLGHGVKFLGRAVTIEENFIMKAPSGIPYVIDASGDSTFGQASKYRVHGEAYFVTVPTLSSIDMAVGNNFAVDRELRYIILPDQPSVYKDKTVPPTIQAWMHLTRRPVFDLETKTATYATCVKEFDRWGYCHNEKYPRTN